MPARQAIAGALTAQGIAAVVVDGESTIGGGSAPGAVLPTRLIELTSERWTADAIETRLRSLDPPVIARIHNDRVVLDVRTVAPSDDGTLTGLLAAAVG